MTHGSCNISVKIKETLESRYVSFGLHRKDFTFYLAVAGGKGVKGLFLRVSVRVCAHTLALTRRLHLMAIALCGTGNASVGRFVHHETSQWSLTSDSPPDNIYSCEEEHVYNEVLPGRLGMFVYPIDVRFHMKDKTRTTRADFNAVVCTERSLLNRERAQSMHHLSVTHDVADDFVPNQDTQNESEEEEDDEEGEEEEEEGGVTAVIDECIESEEEGDS